MAKAKTEKPQRVRLVVDVSAEQSEEIAARLDLLSGLRRMQGKPYSRPEILIDAVGRLLELEAPELAKAKRK